MNMAASFPKTSMKMFLLTVEVLPQKEGGDIAHKFQKLDGLLADYRTATRTVTRVVYKFKVSGEFKILSVIQATNIIGLERTIAVLMRLGDMKVECSPIMSFENFARTLQVGDALTKMNTGSLCKEGLYWLQFDIEYQDPEEYEMYRMLLGTLDYGLRANIPELEAMCKLRGKSTEDFLAVWKKEAETILTARHKEGTSVELYKVVAQRKCHVFINATDPEQVDFLSIKLPLMQENGSNVQITCKALQFLEDYASRINSSQEL